MARPVTRAEKKARVPTREEYRAQRDNETYERYGTYHPTIRQRLLRWVCWVLGE